MTTLVFELDPEEVDMNDEASTSPFCGIHKCNDLSFDCIESPFKLKLKEVCDDSRNTRNVRIINSFSEYKRQKISEFPWFSEWSEMNLLENWEVTYERIAEIHVPNKCYSSIPKSSLNLANQLTTKTTEKSFVFTPKRKLCCKSKLQVSKFISKQNESDAKSKRKKRRNILVKRDKYRRRNDVLMKGVLRQCRKYFQEKYSFFSRTQFAAAQDLTANVDDCLPDNVIENHQALVRTSLRAFCLQEFSAEFKLDDMMFYISCLIFPFELKQQLNEFIPKQNGFLESSKDLFGVKSESTVYDYEPVIDFVHDVLYKFSYQKLEKFNSIPELAYIFQKFKSDNRMTAEWVS